MEKLESLTYMLQLLSLPFILTNFSDNDELKELISVFDKKIKNHDDISTVSDLIEFALTKVISKVGTTLLDDKAVLLPDVHDWFCSFAMQQSHKFNDVNIPTMVTPANILSNLITSLQNHMTYTCCVKKYGILIYRQGTDLTLALTQALWQLRQIRKANSEKIIIAIH